MLSKLNYFTRKEERSVYKNRFVRSYEVEKEDLSAKKTRLWFVFECEALKLVHMISSNFIWRTMDAVIWFGWEFETGETSYK